MVHFPVFPLVACAMGRLMGFKRVFVQEFQGKVHENVFDFTCQDVVPVDLWPRLTGVAGAKRSTIIGEFEYGYLSVFIALDGIIGKAQDLASGGLA